MANVLPENAQKKLRAEQRARFILAGSFAAILCAFIALLALLPAYLVVNASDTGNDAPLPAPRNDQEKTDQAGILRAQQLLRLLAPVSSSSVASIDAALATIAQRPEGVTVQSFALSPGNPATLVLSGTSNTREAINTYGELLRKNPNFNNVAVPIGALTGTDDGHFSVTVTGTF